MMIPNGLTKEANNKIKTPRKIDPSLQLYIKKKNPIIVRLTNRDSVKI